MNEQEIKKQHNEIIGLLKQKRLQKVHTRLREALGEQGDWSLRNKLEQTSTSYQYMMQYMMEGAEDPLREELYQRILKQTWELADQIYLKQMDKVSNSDYHKCHAANKTYESGYRLYDYLRDLECFHDELAICSLMPDSCDTLTKTLSKQLQAADKIFFDIWGNSAWTKDDALDSSQFIISKELGSNERCIFINAVILSLQECFDLQKMACLLTCTRIRFDLPASVRAFVGVALTLIRHADRIALYPELQTRIDLYAEDEEWCKQMNLVYQKLLIAQETEKVYKRMHDEIMPKMMKNVQQFKNKNFDLEDIDEEDFNPDWQDSFDAKLEEHIQEITELSIEGFDVNYTTFSGLKRFEFFNDVQNWLKPFDKNNIYVINSVGLHTLDKPNMLNMLMKSSLFCDSDKYSLCFLMGSIPSENRDAMLQQMVPQDALEQLDLDAIDKAAQQSTEDPALICRTFIEDLYRFYQLYSKKNDFFNPFKQEIALHKMPALRGALNKPEFLKPIADFLFRKERINEALNIYLELVETQKADADIFQKIGYCFQILKSYREAIDAFLKADIIKPDNIWNIRHLATCYRNMKDFTQALVYYRKAEEVQPDNKVLLSKIGSCLVQLERYDEALQYFFRLDLMDEKNVNAWRGISWCSFLCDKYEQANKYIEKVLAESPRATDYLNAGHVAWKLEQLGRTVEYYKKAIISCNSREEFMELFEKDKPILLQKGIAENNISLVLDMTEL